MPRSKSIVHFFYLDKGISLSGRTRLKRFIEGMFKKEGRRAEGVNYIFCSDDYLLEMNRSFLRHDYYTDILTFDLSEWGQPVRAEIYISVDRVRDNAGKLGVSLKSELHRVVFHGALHLCGYRDKKPLEIEKMREMEDKYLKLYFR